MSSEPDSAAAKQMDRRDDMIARVLLTTIESDLLVFARIAGIHGVLGYLNARTRYRFTGICPTPARASGPEPCHAYLYDRDTPSVASLDHRDLRLVSAGIAQLGGMVEALDRQLPDCIPVRSCLGSRLIGRDGATWGTLCHFDQRLRTAPPSEAHLLQFLGSRAGRWLEA